MDKKTATSPRDREKLTRWFLNDRFGMFIHWGVYSIPAQGEWVRSQQRIPKEDYQCYVDAFNPTSYDPVQWARLAKEAGMKYAVLTAKHHDGFCMFDTKTTDYKVTNTKYKKDVVRAFLDAFRAEGIKVGLYYSLIDWSHPDYPHFGDRHHPMRDNEAYKAMPHNFENYKSYMHEQIRELLTGYGKLDIMWFDFSYDDMSGEKWGASQIMDMIEKYQPQMITDNRMDGSGSFSGSILEAEPNRYSGDFSSPEQMIPPGGIVNRIGKSVPWESCITCNGHWGFCKDDHNYKSAKMIIRSLVECVSKNGNLLLNVGPDSDGRIPEESIEILKEIGIWMKKNGESIYGCMAANLPKPEWGRYTMKDNILYAHVYEDTTGPICLSGLGGKVSSIRLLDTDEEVDCSSFWTVARYCKENAFFFTNSEDECSYPLLDEIDTVAKVTLKN